MSYGIAYFIPTMGLGHFYDVCTRETVGLVEQGLCVSEGATLEDTEIQVDIQVGPHGTLITAPWKYEDSFARELGIEPPAWGDEYRAETLQWESHLIEHFSDFPICRISGTILDEWEQFLSTNATFDESLDEDCACQNWLCFSEYTDMFILWLTAKYLNIPGTKSYWQYLSDVQQPKSLLSE